MQVFDLTNAKGKKPDWQKLVKQKLEESS